MGNVGHSEWVSFISAFVMSKDSKINIYSSTVNATLHLILNNSLTICREVATPFAKIISEGQSWELTRLHEKPHVWHGGGFKKMPKSSFQRNFFQNGIHFNKLLYHWTANYCDKQANNCLYTFSAIWPSCFCKAKHTGDSCNGVDRL